MTKLSTGQNLFEALKNQIGHYIYLTEKQPTKLYITPELFDRLEDELVGEGRHDGLTPLRYLEKVKVVVDSRVEKFKIT